MYTTIKHIHYQSINIFYQASAQICFWLLTRDKPKECLGMYSVVKCLLAAPPPPTPPQTVHPPLKFSSRLT